MRAGTITKIALAAILILSPLTGHSQSETLTITNGVQKYTALTNTTVNMSGRCELWVTSSSVAALRLHDPFEFS